jgi:O-antigen ligase
LQAAFDFPGDGHNFLSVNTPGRNFYVTIGGLIAAMILGGLINDDNIALSAGALAVGLGLALYRVLWRGILLEAVILGLMLFGYIVGEWGFGHLHLGESIYFGEVGLAACFLIFGMRVAFTKERFIPRDPLSWAVFAFMGIGTLRYLADLISSSGNTKDMLTITRDFATVYYAAFYFVACNVFKHERSRHFLERLLPVAIIFVLPVVAAITIDPEIFIKLSYHEQSPIYPRSDLAGSFLGFGAIYFMLSREGRDRWFWRTFAGFLCFVFLMSMNSRATILGFGLGMALLLVARKVRVVREFVVFSLFGLIVLAIISAVRPATGDDNLKSLFRDKIVSIFDVGSAANYETDYGSAKASNNHFRTEWWKAVYNETMEKSPLTGLGFGYDLAKRFIATYDLPIDPEDFTARSPHSILASTFGRMGFIGLASFLCVVALIFRSAWRCAVATRKKQAPATDLAAWCGVIIIFVASCFSVMLEGPMAAIVFWSLLGMAAYRQTLAANASQKCESSKVLPRFSSPKKPAVAAAGYQ